MKKIALLAVSIMLLLSCEKKYGTLINKSFEGINPSYLPMGCETDVHGDWELVGVYDSIGNVMNVNSPDTINFSADTTVIYSNLPRPTQLKSSRWYDSYFGSYKDHPYQLYYVDCERAQIKIGYLICGNMPITYKINILTNQSLEFTFVPDANPSLNNIAKSYGYRFVYKKI